MNSHLLGEVEATCDRVAFVKQGRVVHEMALTAAQGAAYLEVELRLSPIDGAVLEGLGRFGTDVSLKDGGRVRMRVAGDAALPDVVRWLVDQQVSVFALESRPKSLEAWFVEVMGEDQRPG